MASYEISNQQEAGNSPDRLVVGGAPAGSTISTLPAGQGCDIVLLEKFQRPQFHFGESPDQELSGYFDFWQEQDKSFSDAYQMRRSEFDGILFKNAIAKGARARGRCRVTGTGFRRKPAIKEVAGELIAL
jgi:flavin-dependent dehydrogenase